MENVIGNNNQGMGDNSNPNFSGGKSLSAQTKTPKQIQKELKELSKLFDKLDKARRKAIIEKSEIIEQIKSTSFEDKRIRLQAKLPLIEENLKKIDDSVKQANKKYREIENLQNQMKAESSKPVMAQTRPVQPASNPNAKSEKLSLEELQKVKEEITKEKEQAENSSQDSNKNINPNQVVDDAQKNSYLPPDQSLPDDITDEELEKYLIEEQKAQEQAIIDAEQQAFEGMSEEEISEAKARKKKFLELQKRYNNKETVNPSDMGDYQKNLDFSINKNLKKFKVKLPKSFLKILISIICVILVVSAVTAYIVLNQPPEPVFLTSLRLSQTITYQTVGEELDLRGLYISCSYSDGSKTTLKASKSLISRTSDNINNNYKITGLLNSKETAFVYFMVEDQEVKLDITLSQIYVEYVRAYLYVEDFTAGDFISFDNLLLLASVSDGRTLRINPESCSFKVAGKLLTRNSKGFYLEVSDIGAQTLTVITTYNNVQYISYVSLYINEQPEPELPEDEAGDEGQVNQSAETIK